MGDIRPFQNNMVNRPIAETGTYGEAGMAVCMLVLHHVADLERAFAEMRRTVSRRLIVLDMLAHDRDLYRRTMGHRHLGFDRDTLVATAEATSSLVDQRLWPMAGLWMA